jgi:hypothetical protein
MGPCRLGSRSIDLASRAVGVLLLTLVRAGGADAGSISFPVTLDPTIPNAWVVAVYIHDEIEDRSDESTYLDVLPTVQAGYFDEVTGGGGAFSALDYGALGISSYGFPDGGGTGSHAYMLVNVPFSGSGTNTVTFDVQGSEFLGASNVISSSNVFMATMSYTVLDAASYAVLATGSATEYECDPVGPCATQLSFPIELSAPFTIDRPSLVQFNFSLFSQSNGFAAVQAARTGLVTVDLAPGVTMDTSSGFLSTPGDPGIAPEPSAASLSVAAGAVLAVFAGRSRRLERVRRVSAGAIVRSNRHRTRPRVGAC